SSSARSGSHLLCSKRRLVRRAHFIAVCRRPLLFNTARSPRSFEAGLKKRRPLRTQGRPKRCCRTRGDAKGTGATEDVTILVMISIVRVPVVTFAPAPVAVIAVAITGMGHREV